jgi:hypothetical protein
VPMFMRSPLSDGLMWACRVIEPESGRTLLDTRGQDGAAPAVEFQTGAQPAVACAQVGIKVLASSQTGDCSSKHFSGRAQRQPMAVGSPPHLRRCGRAHRRASGFGQPAPADPAVGTWPCSTATHYAPQHRSDTDQRAAAPAGMAMVPEGLDMAVRLMTPGEVSTVRAAPGFGYDGRADRPEVRALSLAGIPALSRLATSRRSGTGDQLQR